MKHLKCLSLLILFLFPVFAFAQEEPVKQKPKPINNNTQQNYSNKLILKVIPDLKCKLIIDGEDKGIFEPNQIKKIYLAEGSYLIESEFVDNPKIKYSEVYSVTKVNIEKIYKINLQKIKDSLELLSKGNNDNLNTKIKPDDNKENATLEETLGWIKSKVNEKNYKVLTSSYSNGNSIKYFEDITFNYDISDYSIEVIVEERIESTRNGNDVHTTKYKLRLADVDSICPSFSEDTIEKEILDGGKTTCTDHYYNDYNVRLLTKGKLITRSRSANGNDKNSMRSECVIKIAEKTDYVRLEKAFKHAVFLAKKNEKF